MAEPRAPSAIRALLAFSRELAIGLRRIIADEALIKATRRDLGLPELPPGSPSPDTATADDKLRQIEEKLAEFDGRPEEEFALDEQVAEFLIGGGEFAQVLELMLPGRDASDPRTYLDLTYALATIFASEWYLRPRLPWLYAFIRLLMLGYERVEDVPRFDPFAIFDRLTGRTTRTTSHGFGAAEAVGGLVVPPLITAFNAVAAHTGGKHDLTRLIDKAAEGTPYLVAKFDVAAGWDPGPDAPLPVQELLARALTVGLEGTLKLHDRDDEFPLEFLVTAMFVPQEDGGPGFLVRGGGTAEVKIELPPGSNKAIKRHLEVRAVGGPGLDLFWNTDTGEVSSLGASGGAPNVELAVEFRGTEAVPAVRIGTAGKSRLDLVGLKLGWTIGVGAQFGYIEFEDGELIIRFEDLVALPGVRDFFKTVGGEHLSGRVDGKLKLDGKQGLMFEGEAGLKVRLASHAALGNAVRIDYLDLVVGAGTGGGIAVGLETAARFHLGPFTISVDRTGFAAVFIEDHGRIRIRDDFRPPKGIGLKLESGIVSGGGFLLLDYERGEFAGAFELWIAGLFGVQAIAILTTKVPGSAPFALFVMGFLRFPGGLELGLRFTLNAVGGLVGLHHGFDRAALEQALPSGAMDDVLFPADAVGDAPRIINSLRRIFPVQSGGLTLGFMLELGWGSDYLCSIRVGLVFPLENVLDRSKNPPSLSRVVLLGRLALDCFKVLPKLIRLQIICDFVGEIVFDPFSIRFYARIRDSRFGPIAIEGAIVFSLTTAGGPRLIIAAGGFHPNYKQIPNDLPAPINRLATTYNIGIVKVWARAYLAVAPGTIQFGAELGIRYTFGPLSLGGELGLDALISLPPDFRFEVTVHGAVGVRFRDHDLLGVSLELTVWGPRRWRVKGRGEFTILFWDVPIHFDESWGDEDALSRERIKVFELVAADLKETTNWRLEPPRNASLLVTIAEPAGGTERGASVHPLSVLSYTQRRVPFNVQLQRYGSAAVEGPTLFPIPAITDAAGVPFLTTSVLTEQFAVAEYLDLRDEDRLSRPGFQLMAAGVATSTEGYSTPPDSLLASVTLEYEEKFRDTADRRVQGFVEFDRADLERVVSAEAAGRSPRRWGTKLADSSVRPVVPKPPEWVAAEPDQLRPAAVARPDWAATSPALVSALAGVSDARLMVVEAFEVGL